MSDPLAGLRPQPIRHTRATMFAAARDALAEAENDPEMAAAVLSVAPDGLCRMTGVADAADMLRMVGTVLDRLRKVVAAEGRVGLAATIDTAMATLTLRSTPL